jgi:hypothetical protein
LSLHGTITTDDRYGTVHVAAWSGLSPKLGCRGHWRDHDVPPIVPGTVVRVDVEHLPKPTSRTKNTLWLWVAGPDPDLEVCWRAYLRRFDIEHTFRFAKNTLGWTCALPNKPTAGPGSWPPPTPNYTTPCQRPRRRPTPPMGNAAPSPTDSPQRAFDERFAAPHQPWGTPARPPKPSNPGPGRPKDSPTGPRTRYPTCQEGGLTPTPRLNRKLRSPSME